MATQVTNYQCPACTGPLRFRSDTGRLECEYCGSVYTPAEIEAMYAQQTASAAQAAQTEAAHSAGEEWDAAGAGADWGEEAGSLRVYNCPSCGAELLCEETTAATSCPYCGNPSVLPGQFSGAKKPDYIIPFRLDRDAALAALKKHYAGKPFLPRLFSQQNHLEKVQGLYVPFWLFDARADADVTFRATRVHSHRSGDYEETITENYQVRRAGSAEFRRIPVDGSTKMPDDHMDSIEPFDYGELTPFSMAYLPGYLADKYDVSAQESAPRADERCRRSAVQLMRQDVQGYTAVMPQQENVRLQKGAVKYALLPVWVLNTRWKDKDYLFAMNGQTGKLVGDLPVSRAKYWGVFLAITALCTALFHFTGVGSLLANLVALLLE